MNRVVIKYTDCQCCTYCDYRGSYGVDPRYVCTKLKDETLVSDYDKTKTIPIPDWCPLLRKV